MKVGMLNHESDNELALEKKSQNKRPKTRENSFKGRLILEKLAFVPVTAS